MASTAHIPAQITLDVLHKHLGHPSTSTLWWMIQKGLVEGVVIQDVKSLPDPVCDACIRAKMTSFPFKTGHKHATN